MCRHLAAAEHDIVWAASDADQLPQDDCFKTLPLQCVNPTEALTGLPMPIPLPGALRALSNAVKQSDVVIIHDTLYCTSIAATIAAKRQGKPVLLIQHVAEIPFSSVVLRGLMKLANAIVTRPMMRGVNQTLFISETVRSAFERYPKNAPAELVFNGVDQNIFHPKTPDRARFGLPEHGEVMAFVGRFVEKKGLSVLEALARARPDLHFAMAGAGPIAPDTWQLHNVHVLGKLQQSDIATLFATADYLLLPSVGEGYPLVIQEAMAVGLPVICGTESAHADPNANRWLCGVDVTLADPVATAKRVSAAIDTFTINDDDRRAMAQYATTHYNWGSFAERIASAGKLVLAPANT